MNFLHVTASMDPAKGGLSQGLRNSIPELIKLDVHNEVACLDNPETLDTTSDNFEVHALGSRGPWAYSKNLLPWLQQNLSRFDVVFIHGLWLYHSHATIKALGLFRKQFQHNGREKEIKVFVMPHGMLDPYFQQATGRKLKAIRNWIYWKLIENKVINEANGLLFTCETELRLARIPFRPYTPKREINVGFGIEPPPLHKPSMDDAFMEKCPGLMGKQYLLFLSRIHPKKGLDMLIGAYLEMVQTCKVELPELVVVGPGLDTAYGKKMVDLVKSNDALRDLIHFTGMLSGDAKWGAFYGCEAFILPSHQENFGIAVVEAMACNKPVLISNQVNIWQEIKEAGGGLVAENTTAGTLKMLKTWMGLTTGEKQLMETQAKDCYLKNFEMASSAGKWYEAAQQNELSFV